MATGTVRKLIRTKYVSDLPTAGGLTANSEGQLIVDKAVVQQGLTLFVNKAAAKIELKDAGGVVLDSIQLETVTNLSGNTIRGWIDLSTT